MNKKELCEFYKKVSKKKSAILLMPIIWDSNIRLPNQANPKIQKKKLDFLLEKGWKVKIMNEIIHEDVTYSHILVEAQE